MTPTNSTAATHRAVIDFSVFGATCSYCAASDLAGPHAYRGLHHCAWCPHPDHTFLSAALNFARCPSAYPDHNQTRWVDPLAAAPRLAACPVRWPALPCLPPGLCWPLSVLRAAAYCDGGWALLLPDLAWLQRDRRRCHWRRGPGGLLLPSSRVSTSSPGECLRWT